MKTYFISISELEPETFKKLLGFTLTVGLNFRKIEFISNEKKVSDVLVIEIASKIEEKALKKFLEESFISVKFTVDTANKAKNGLKKVGNFCEVISNDNDSYYLDKKTGKRFTIVQGEVQ